MWPQRTAHRLRRARALIHSPLRPNWFESDEGQFDPTIAYRHLDGQGRLCLLDDGAFVTQLVHSESASSTADRIFDPGDHLDASRMRLRGASVRFEFVDGDLGPASWTAVGDSVVPLVRIARREHADVSDGRTVATFSAVDRVFADADLRVRFLANDVVGYEIHVGPRATKTALTIRVTGSTALAIDEDGSLVVSTEQGTVRHTPPVVVGEAGALGARSWFESVDASTVRIAWTVGEQGTPVVIDPTLVYSTYLGGSSIDSIESVALHPTNGTAYFCGLTLSADLPVTPGSFDVVASGGFDAFVGALNAAGTALQFLTYFGGTGDDLAFDLEVDSTGAVYVGGATSSSNFPVTAGAYSTTLSGWFDGFAAKFAPGGGTLLFSTYIGGSFTDAVFGIALTGTNTLYVVGQTESDRKLGAPSLPFPVTSNAYQPHLGNGSACSSGAILCDTDAFVARFDPTGTTLPYSSLLGGDGSDGAKDVVLQAWNRPVLLIETNSTGIPGALTGSNNGWGGLFVTVPAGDPGEAPGWFTSGQQNDDTYVAILDVSQPAFDPANPQNGNPQRVFGCFVDGTAFDNPTGIALEPRGTGVVVCGVTTSSDFPNTIVGSGPNCSGSSCKDGFVVKLDPSVAPASTPFVWSRYLGGTQADSAGGVAVDRAGQVFVVGDTASTVFPLGPSPLDPTHNGAADAFAIRMNAAGTIVLDGTYIGGTDDDFVLGLGLSTTNQLWFAGSTNSANYPTSVGAFQVFGLGPFPAPPNGLGLDTTLGEGFVTSLQF
jgi:hypothetical protein